MRIVWVVGIYWAFDETEARHRFGVDAFSRVNIFA